MALSCSVPYILLILKVVRERGIRGKKSQCHLLDRQQLSGARHMHWLSGALCSPYGAGRRWRTADTASTSSSLPPLQPRWLLWERGETSWFSLEKAKLWSRRLGCCPTSVARRKEPREMAGSAQLVLSPGSGAYKWQQCIALFAVWGDDTNFAWRKIHHLVTLIPEPRSPRRGCMGGSGVLFHRRNSSDKVKQTSLLDLNSPQGGADLFLRCLFLQYPSFIYRYYIQAS